MDATRALGIKLAVGRGGHIHDLYYADIQSLSVQYFFVIYSKHNQRKEGMLFDPLLLFLRLYWYRSTPIGYYLHS